MRRPALLFAVVTALFICTGSAFALTPAGTTITNTASASYTIAGAPQTATTATSSFKVAQLVNLSVAWQDSGPISVAPNDTNKLLTFKITNTGNATDTLALTINNALVGDNFDPTATTQPIWLDTNGSGVYDTGDTAALTISLAPGASQTIFLLNNIPVSLADAVTGNSQLAVTSSFTPGAVGKVFPGAGPNGSDVVLGILNGAASATGTYKVSAAIVSLTKTSIITDPYGGTAPVPGATVMYTITANLLGNGTAAGVVITDPVPANTTYKPGTLTLNGAALTDTRDSDAGDVGGTTANTATILLGDLTAASGTKTITFKTVIN